MKKKFYEKILTKLADTFEVQEGGKRAYGS